nr:integrase, catalytic region, zinc finger, CCHC-type, peptidase aspartic, catalytic [Tanacetum cinerariifolium]
VILPTSVSRPQLKSNPIEDRVLRTNSHGKKQEVENHRRNVKLPKNKTSVTACNESLNAKTLNVKSISAMCDKCVLNDKHDMCVLKSVAKPIKRTVASESNKKPRNFTRKIYEHVSKTCSWWKSTCFIHDLKGNDLLSGSRGTDLYWITLQDTNSPNPICLVAKATSSQAWLWHRRLFHLNFDTINLLSKNDIVVGLLKVKFVKDHLCSSSSINGKRYVLVIVDDYSSYTWTHFLRSKDETPEVLIDFLRLVQRGLQAQVGVTLHAYFVAEGIQHQTDGENLDKMKEKGDECIFVRYFTESKTYRVFNKRTRVIMESIHVNFDELPRMASDQNSSDPAPECQTMASDQNSSDPAPECQTMALNHDSLSPAIQHQGNVTQADSTVTTSNELDLLFSPMFDELLNGSSKVVSKSSAVSTADAPNQQRYAENDQVADDEFINIFSTLVQDQGETSSCHVDSSNMHTFYQRFPSEHRWTKDHC